MRILADEEIFAVRQAFASLGELHTLPGRAIDRQAMRTAVALLVRSITRVDAGLLDGSPVRFVGSATAGIDHIDTEYLASHGIVLAHAPGSNAPAVAQYVAAAILELAHDRELRLARQTLGVVGVGHVGSRVVNLAQSLGLPFIANDPPRANRAADPALRPLDELLARATIITLHVPLTVAGPHATHRMVDDEWLNRLRPGAILINTSRGDVIDEEALKAIRRRGHIAGLALDVWRNEPRPDAELVQLTDLATPHIAGYSVESRHAAARVIHDAFCRWARQTSAWRCEPEPASPTANLPGPSDDGAWRERMRRVFDIAEVSRRFKNAMTPGSYVGAAFDAMRRASADRRELPDRHER